MPDAKTILVIDDDDALRHAMETKFSGKGYTVITSRDGAEGLDALEHSHIDVVLTDLQMPNVDGFGVLEKIATTQNAETPVYIITNLGSDTHCARALKLGAKKCFIKSLVTLRDVVEMVDAAVA